MAAWMTRLEKNLNGERERMVDMSLKMALVMGKRLLLVYGPLPLDTA